MPIAAITRLRVRRLSALPRFLGATRASARQARRAPGLLAGALFIENLHTYWTITVWQDEAAMLAYRNSGDHKRIMPRLLDWCDEAVTAHAAQEGDEVGDLARAHQMLVAGGTFVKLPTPSADHQERRVPPPRCARPRLRQSITPAPGSQELSDAAGS